jgi:hypothetical protein
MENQSFDDYLKNNTSSIHHTQSNSQEQSSTQNIIGEDYSSFIGSREWLDLTLDSSYYNHYLTSSTCIQFCLNSNVIQEGLKLEDQERRREVAGCQFNCLNKMSYGLKIHEKLSIDHPRNLKRKEIGSKLIDTFKELQKGKFKADVLSGQQNLI